MKVKRAADPTLVKENHFWVVIKTNTDGMKQIVGSEFNKPLCDIVANRLKGNDQESSPPVYYRSHRIDTIECID